MNPRTDLPLVLKMRAEAAEILRRHDEATGRIGATYRAATRQVEVFQESLQQTVKEMTSLTGAVRAVSGDVGAAPVLKPWAAAGAGDLARTLETARELARERTAGGIDESRLVLLRRNSASDRVGDIGEEGRRTIAWPARQPSTVDDWTVTEPGSAAHRFLREQEAYAGLRDGRTVVAAIDLPDLRAVSELTAAVDAVLRNQVLLMRSDSTSIIGPQEVGSPSKAIEYSRSMTVPEQPIEPQVPVARTFAPMAITLSRNTDPLVDLDPERQARESLARYKFDESPFETMIAAERRKVIAEISEYFTSLSREVGEATAQIKRRFEIDRGRKDEERAVERLKLEMNHLAPTRREIEEVAADRGAWSRTDRDAVLGTAVGRLPSAAGVPGWIGSTAPAKESIGADLRQVTGDWRTYVSGVAGALGATDQALTGILTQTRDWRSAMHGLISSVVTDFAKIAIRQNVTGPLAEAVLGGGRNGGDPGLLGRAFGWITSLFAGGGIMTAHGPLPLRTYASGGIATSPQLALFGEGSTPEAYVPVPNGRIPVTLRGGMGIGSIATNIVINVATGGGTADPVVGSDPAERARSIGALVTAAFNRNLAEQMRPGGLLNPAGYLGNGLAH